VAGGNVQRDFISKEDSSSPTASTKSVLLTSVVDASKERDVAIIDVPDAFIQTRVNKEKNRVHISIAGKVVEWLVETAPEVYAYYVYYDKRGTSTMIVECFNAIYGTMVAGLLYYRKFTGSLKKHGYTMNPCDPCVWNKDINGKQCTIVFHVDDCRISHVDPRVIDKTMVFTDGSGKMIVA